MAGIFKNIGHGIGYFFFFPFIIVAIALYAVFGIFVFLFQFVKLIVLFFTGRTLFSDLEEDIRLKALNTPDQPAENQEQASQPEGQQEQSPSNSPMYGSGYISPIFTSQEESAPAQSNDIHIEVPNSNAVEVEPEVEREPEIEREPGEIHIDIGGVDRDE